MPNLDCGHQTHVETCPSCLELEAIVRAFAEDQEGLLRDAQVPSSAIVWWRAQMRSRREAAQVVAQPMTIVQGLTLACAAGLVMAAIGYFSPVFSRALAWTTGMTEAIPAVSLSLPVNILTNPMVLAGIAALGLCAIVLPLALYFTPQD